MLSKIQDQKRKNMVDVFDKYYNTWKSYVFPNLATYAKELENSLLDSGLPPPNYFLIRISYIPSKKYDNKVLQFKTNTHEKNSCELYNEEFIQSFSAWSKIKNHINHPNFTGSHISFAGRDLWNIHTTHYLCVNFDSRLESLPSLGIFQFQSIESTAHKLFHNCSEPDWDQMIEQEKPGGLAAIQYNQNGELDKKGWEDLFAYLKSHRLA